jgi:tRNA(Ile)-lysidine synthase
LQGVGLEHVDRILALAGGPSGKRIPLPGGREAVVEFHHMRIGPRRHPPEPFAIAIDVPGRVDLPDGRALDARSDAGPAESNAATAVVAAPDGPLVVRTRRPGDRVRAKGRDMSLKKFLMERRVPADARAGLPLLTAGSRVLWVPGQPMDADGAGRRYVRVRLERKKR